MTMRSDPFPEPKSEAETEAETETETERATKEEEGARPANNSAAEDTAADSAAGTANTAAGTANTAVSTAADSPADDATDFTAGSAAGGSAGGSAELVRLHVWRVPRHAVGSAMLRMAFARQLLRERGVRFGKFLGTGTGRGFGPGDADLTRYAAITVSDHPVRFPEWERIAVQQAHVDLEPLISRGEWSGRSPFQPTGRRASGMVLALTRARLRPTRALRFWQAVPAVVRELDAAPGLLARFGVGEAPIGWQGTVSVWRTAADLTAFAYRQPEHRAAIARTPVDRWYAEELFARFAVLGISGDRPVLNWTADEREHTPL